MNLLCVTNRCYHDSPYTELNIGPLLPSELKQEMHTSVIGRICSLSASPWIEFQDGSFLEFSPPSLVYNGYHGLFPWGRTAGP